MASQNYLIVAIPEEEPISYLISGEKTTIGRAPQNDIQILVAEVSTAHGEITTSDHGCEISDVGSSNGTRVKGQSITNGKISLNDRDTILFGETISAYFVTLEEGVEPNPSEIIDSITGESGDDIAPVAALGTALPKVPGVPQVAGSEAGASTVVLSKVVPTKVAGPAVPQKKVAPSVGLPAVAKKVAPNLAAPAVPGKLPIVPKKVVPNLAAPKPVIGGKVPIVKKK